MRVASDLIFCCLHSYRLAASLNQGARVLTVIVKLLTSVVHFQPQLLGTSVTGTSIALFQ